MQRPLFHKGSEYIGNRLVQGSRLAMIFKTRRVFGNAVRQLMGDHVEGAREVGEDHVVSVTEDHLLTVPERIVILEASMYIRIEAHSFIVDGVSRINLPVEIACRAKSVKGAIDGRIVRCTAALRPPSSVLRPPSSLRRRGRVACCPGNR